MDKGCGTCAHWEIPTYKSPCSECVASGTFSGWELAGCKGCAHEPHGKLYGFGSVTPCVDCQRYFPKSEADYYEAKVATDPVNHPAHYTECSLECIDVMLAVFGRKAVTDFCILNAFKYMWRYEHKNGLEDLQKAERYLAMATDFQMADTEQENRIINMKAVLEVLMRRVNK